MSSWFLYLLFFLVPIQTSFHITTDFAKIAGIYLDYLLPTIYLTDFIIISIIFFSYREKKLKLGKPLLFFLIYCLFNVLFISDNKGASFYKFVKITEFAFLFPALFKVDFNKKTAAFALATAVFYSSILAIAQFI